MVINTERFQLKTLMLQKSIYHGLVNQKGLVNKGIVQFHNPTLDNTVD
jgi:hypothetical protein